MYRLTGHVGKRNRFEEIDRRVTRDHPWWDHVVMQIDDFADFYHREQHALVRFAATIVGPDRADDVVANAMVSMMKRYLGEPDGPDSLRPYIYTAVANAGAKEWRTLSRRQRREAMANRLHPTPLSAPDPGQRDHLSPDVAAALAKLSPRQRAVVHLAYWEDLRPSDIAGRLAISEGSVRRHLARARQKLRAALQPTAAESDHDAQSLLGGAR